MEVLTMSENEIEQTAQKLSKRDSHAAKSALLQMELDYDVGTLKRIEDRAAEIRCQSYKRGPRTRREIARDRRIARMANRRR